MKLSKLYCNDISFHNIEFNLSGISVVYAEVRSELAEKKNSHSLGKTKLSQLIDYLFLKTINKDHFLLKHKDGQDISIFNEHIFYLELLLNSGKFLTIRRSIQANTKISFAVNATSVEGFIPPTNWEHENLAIKKAKLVLSNYLMLDFFKYKSYDYRKAISYSLRTPPEDYSDVYQLSKFGKGRDLYWKPFMFDLLGFDGELLLKKYENDKKREDISQFIVTLKKEYSIKVEDRDDYVAQVKLVESDASEIESEIDRFNFYKQDKALIQSGIEEIETSISNLNTEAYNLNYEIDKLRRSIKNKFAFDVDKVNKVFQEANLYFADQLKQDYEALINFNNELTKERNKLLKDSLTKKSDALKEVEIRLIELNKEKEDLLSHLQDTDSFRKFKQFQKNLVKIEGELFSLKEKISNIDKIIKKEGESDDLLKAIEGTIKDLKKVYQHTEDNVRYSNIRNMFSKIYKKIMDEDARISWNINSNNNVDFIPPKVHGKDLDQKVTGKDEGNTYKKLLCVAFDLAILGTYSNESYFRFVYHDDVLSQQDNGIKLRLLHQIGELTRQHDLQYILSVIKSDLPQDENENLIYFKDQEIVLRLHDKDKSGTLFGIEF